MKKLLLLCALISTTFTHGMEVCQVISNLVAQTTNPLNPTPLVSKNIIDKIITPHSIRYEMPLENNDAYKYVFLRQENRCHVFIQGESINLPNNQIIIRHELSDEEAEKKFNIIEAVFAMLQS